jgi:anti-anti-sigma regulatory factor
VDQKAVTTRLRRDGSVVVELRGDIGPQATGVLCRALVDAVLRRRPVLVVLDMRRTRRIDPQGVGALIAGQDLAADRDTPVIVHRPSPGVARQLRAAGLPGACISGILGGQALNLR